MTFFTLVKHVLKTNNPKPSGALLYIPKNHAKILT